MRVITIVGLNSLLNKFIHNRYLLNILPPIAISLYLMYPLLKGDYLYPLSEYEIYKSFMLNFIETLKNGELPVWNEYVGSGHPTLYFGHYPISQNTLIYMVFGFSDFTFYFTRFLNLTIMFLSFIYACKFLKLGYLISLIGALTYFSINFVIRVFIPETIGNLVFLYPLLVIFIVKIIEEDKTKDVLIFNLFYIFWLAGGHIIYVYMHLMMLSIFYWITVFVFNGYKAFKLIKLRKFTLLYFILFIIPFLAVLYQYYFIYDVISVSNRFKEGLIASPFEAVVWKQLIASFKSSSYFWFGLLSILIYIGLKLLAVNFKFVGTRVRITSANMLLMLVVLLFLTVANIQFSSNSDIITDYIPIFNSVVFRISLMLYLIIHLFAKRAQYAFFIKFSDFFIFLVYISLLSYYFFSPQNIIGDVNGYDFDLFRELSIVFQIIFTLSVLFSSKDYRNSRIVKIVILSAISLYLIRSHFTIPLLRFYGIVWYATRDGSIFSVFFAILFMFGLKNILSCFHHIVRDKEGAMIKYVHYAVISLILALLVQDSFTKLYKGTSHRFVYPNQIEFANTAWEKYILEGREQIPLLNNKLLELNKETKHFYRVFSAVNSYLYLAGNLQQYKIHEAIIYDSSISRDLQDFCDYTILEKTPDSSRELKDAMPYFLFTRHVHAGLNLDFRNIPYRDVFVLDPERDIQYVKKKNIEFLWDLMQVKYLIIESKLSIALEGFANKAEYKQHGNYNKLGFNLYEILRNKNYSRIAVLPLDDQHKYNEVIKEINSKNIDTLKGLYSRLVFFDKNSSDFRLLKSQNFSNRRYYEIASKKEALLIEFESWHSNWELKVNDENKRPQKAFQIFRSIKIEPGLNRIEAVYHLKYFNALFLLFIFIILIHILLIGIIWVKNMDKNMIKIRFFMLVYLLMVVLILSFGVELIVYLFSKTGRLTLATKSEIFAISKGESSESKVPKPVYIPHPYFGYVYNPSTRVSQFNYVSNIPVYMDSNSDGFIDKEFPLEKRAKICVYGILGGSAAMSWGVDNKGDSISYQLEKRLNERLRNDKCNEYRVLNMGIGSHLLYQSTQIHLYYKKLLDGIIFFGGFNECAHGAMLTNNDPVEFPVVNLYASLQMPSSLILKISDMQQELIYKAKFLVRYPYLLHSPSLRFFLKRKARRIEELQKKLQNEGHQTTLPNIKGKFKEDLQKLFPWVTAFKFLQSYDYENPDIPILIEKILPPIYTEPILNAYAVSKSNSSHFLSVIQPMMYITGSATDWKTLNFASYHFQKSCVEKLVDESKRLKSYGVKTYNLNDGYKNAFKKDFFIDHVHLKKEGSEAVAQILFEIIKKEWH